MTTAAPWRHSLTETSRRGGRGRSLFRIALKAVAVAALLLTSSVFLSRCASAQEDRILMWCDLDAGPSGECFRVGRIIVRTQCRAVAKTMNERRDERLRMGVSPGFVALCIIDRPEK